MSCSLQLLKRVLPSTIQMQHKFHTRTSRVARSTVIATKAILSARAETLLLRRTSSNIHRACTQNCAVIGCVEFVCANTQRLREVQACRQINCINFRYRSSAKIRGLTIEHLLDTSNGRRAEQSSHAVTLLCVSFGRLLLRRRCFTRRQIQIDFSRCQVSMGKELAATSVDGPTFSHTPCLSDSAVL